MNPKNYPRCQNQKRYTPDAPSLCKLVPVLPNLRIHHSQLVVAQIHLSERMELVIDVHLLSQR